MNNVVLISTHSIGSGASFWFSDKEKVYSETLAEYLFEKYQLGDITALGSNVGIKTAEEIFNSSVSFLCDKQKSEFQYRLIDGEKYSVVKDILTILKGVLSSGVIDNDKNISLNEEQKTVLNSLILEISNWLKDFKKNSSNSLSIPENIAKDIRINKYNLFNTTLCDLASIYKYNYKGIHPKIDSQGDVYAVYGVMELKVPEKKINDTTSWEWENILIKAINVDPNHDRIFLLLHDKDLIEYHGHKFHCIKYEQEKGVSLAVFQHSNLDLLSIFSDKNDSKEVFNELDYMLSVFSNIRECNDKNIVSKHYYSLIKD